jgi:hypothetical protein
MLDSSSSVAVVSRCLVGDSAHDLEVVFRLVQLWLSLGAEAGTVRQLRTAFKATPSHKFLPLMYQMASRLSAASSGPLVSSGFQARILLSARHLIRMPLLPVNCLWHLLYNCHALHADCPQASLKELLVRLTVDHPYHSLYHIYALANGNRDALGRRMQGHVRPGCTLCACKRLRIGHSMPCVQMCRHSCRQLTGVQMQLSLAVGRKQWRDGAHHRSGQGRRCTGNPECHSCQQIAVRFTSQEKLHSRPHLGACPPTPR